ncbi:hypothetical protein pb186bvf_019221 [Paramecium bursaria]
MADSLELLQLEDDMALLFRPKNKPIEIDEQFEPQEQLNLRQIKSLNVTILYLELNTKNQYPQIIIKSQIPIIRGQQIEYQTHQVMDVDRNGKKIIYNTQFKSNFNLTDKLLPIASQSTLQFTVTTPEAELGNAEFNLNTMIMDGLRQFQYTLPVKQKIEQKQQGKQKKQNQIQVIEVGKLLIEVQLQEGGKFYTPKKEIDIDEQTNKIREEIMKQIQKEREIAAKQEEERIQQVEQEIYDKIRSFQLYLNIINMVRINRESCLQKIGDDQLNLFIQHKSYGSQDLNHTETYWNVFKLNLNYQNICPANYESVQKMEKIQWVIELWGKQTDTNKDVLIGVGKINLSYIHTQIFGIDPIKQIKILKSNIHPLIVFDGELAFEDLRSKQIMAIFRVKVAFGTTYQVNRLSNQEFPQMDPSQFSEEEPENPSNIVLPPEIQPEPPKEEEKRIERLDLDNCLIEILNKINFSLKIYPKEQYILIDEFKDILNKLTNIDLQSQIIASLEYYFKVDQYSTNWQSFSNTWKAFNNYKISIKERYTKIYTTFYQSAIQVYNSINFFERQIQTNFGLIDVRKLREFLLNAQGNNQPSGPTFSPININQVVETLEINQNNEVQVHLIFDYLRQIEVHQEVVNLHIPILQISKVVEKNLIQWAKVNEERIQMYLETRDFLQKMTPYDIVTIFEDLQYQFTLLDGIVAMHQIKDYSGIEHVDGVPNCAEIAFWKYIEWIQNKEVQITPKKQEPQPPVIGDVTQPIPRGKKGLNKLDKQYTKIELLIQLLQVQFQSKQYQEDSIYNIKLQNLDLSQIAPRVNHQILATLYNDYDQEIYRSVENKLFNSGLEIQLLSRDANVQYGMGLIAIEEILQLKESETFFVSIMHDKTFEQIALIEISIDLKYMTTNQREDDKITLLDNNGKVLNEPKISFQELEEKLRPEIQHTFRIEIRSIKWFKQIMHKDFKFRVSLGTDKKILKQAIPQFISDEYQNEFNIVLEYKVKCDQILANQISKCNIIVEMLIQNFTLIGYIPLSSLFQDKIIEGEIPLDDSKTGMFCSILNICATFETDQVMKQKEVVEQLDFNKKIVVRILDYIIFDYEHELGEIYFMIINPIMQSQSYQVQANQPNIINTWDCVFILDEKDLQTDMIEIQVRSVFLGEDKIVGSLQIQLTQFYNEGMFVEANYLSLDQSEFKIQSRVGVKIIYICVPTQYSLNIDKIFSMQSLQDLNKDVDLKTYFRQTIGLSFSEIQYLMGIVNKDIFSREIIQTIVIQSDNNNLIEDLYKEFKFFDITKRMYVNQDKVTQVLQYFGIKDFRNIFVQQLSKRKPIDYEAKNFNCYDKFDYLLFLAIIQMQYKQFQRIFIVNETAQITHQIDEVLRKSSPKPKIRDKTPSKIQRYHYQIVSAHNLNQFSNRIPNSYIKIPECNLQTDVFYAQKNPEINLQFSYERSFTIQLYDKKINQAEKSSIYSNQLVREIMFDPQSIKLNDGYKEVKLYFQEKQDQRNPYVIMKVWNDSYERTNKRSTVRKLVEEFNQYENDPRLINNQIENEQLRNLTKNLDSLINTLQRQPVQPQNVSSFVDPNIPANAIVNPPNPPDVRREQPEQQKKPQLIYNSSESSSNQQNRQQGRSSSSGTKKLEKINEKIPYDGETLTRIERILRQNNLQGYESSDSD